MRSSFFFNIKNKFFSYKHQPDIFETNQLTFIYDLEYCCPSFNIFEYLLVASYDAFRSSVPLRVVIVKGGISTDLRYGIFNEVYALPDIDNRIENIILPATKFFKNICEVVVVDRNRISQLIRTNRLSIRPKSYDPLNSNSYTDYSLYSPSTPKFKASCVFSLPEDFMVSARRFVRGSRSGLVTITIRQSRFDSVRNSNLEAWEEFSRYLLQRGYEVIVFPEMEGSTPLTGTLGECSIPKTQVCMRVRAGIYALAAINMGVANGPMLLAHLIPHNATIQVNVAPSCSLTSDPETWRKNSLDPNCSFAWSEGIKVVTTRQDKIDTLIELFESTVATANATRIGATV